MRHRKEKITKTKKCFENVFFEEINYV
jgi:hypothetical protein